MKLSRRASGAAIALGIGLLGAMGASADPIATYSPSNDSANIFLTGLSLSAFAPVTFDYQTPNLSALGDLAAVFSLSASETGAVAFGPIALATFDGTFGFTYAGPTKTAGGITVHTGDNLLSGTFLGSVFTGYGSSGGLVDSILGGGLVSFDNNGFLTFSGLGDEAVALNLDPINPLARVVAGQLSDFAAVSGGEFDADGYTEITGKGGVPEPATWTMMLAGFFGAGAALRRAGAATAQPKPRRGRAIGAGLLALALGAFGAAGANATTFASFRPVGGTPNMALSGTNLSASSAVLFKYLPPSLAAFGDLAAQFSLSASETGAISFGPLALGTFDGSFAFKYSGTTRTVGGITVHTGDSLLSGTFLGSVFTGYGSAASLTDSVVAGGLVSFNNSGFLTFNPTGDESLSLGLTSIKPNIAVIAGQLSDFSGVSTGQFAADGFTAKKPAIFRGFAPLQAAVPEPATWALMLTGFGLAGVSLRRRRAAIAA